jgi:hypothetical protein
MSTFVIKRNDTLPPIDAVLAIGTDDPDVNTPVDLTGCTVAFILREQCSKLAKFRGAGQIVGDPTLGQARYQWQTGDTNVAGNFFGEFEVTDAAGHVASYPSPSYIPIRIPEDLG